MRTIKGSVTTGDVGVLVGSVESLGDPSEYCKNDFDDQTPAGYFLYIDFISALIIDLGEPAKEKTAEFENSDHPFVKWVVRYVTDARFHPEISAKFVDVFAEQ